MTETETETEAKRNLEAAEKAVEKAAETKLHNLKNAVLEATQLEGYDHVEPPVDHLISHLRTYQYTSRAFDVLTATISHLGWLLKHKSNEVHALRLMIRNLCPSDVATQILERKDLGLGGSHADSFQCPRCDALRPNQEAPSRRSIGTVAVLQRLCDDCIQGKPPPKPPPFEQALERKEAAWATLTAAERAKRSRPAQSPWWVRLTTWRRRRLPAARLVPPRGRDPKKDPT